MTSWPRLRETTALVLWRRLPRAFDAVTAPAGTGEYWATGKVKAKLIDVLQKLVREHQERRARITDDEVREWMQIRRII
jgi:hypothetical protein